MRPEERFWKGVLRCRPLQLRGGEARDQVRMAERLGIAFDDELPELTRQQVEAIGNPRLSTDSLVRKKTRISFGLRFITVGDDRAALRVENIVKRGQLPSGPPRPNTVVALT